MREVTIIGAGRTGRGMLGELFYKEGDFHITFADCNPELVEGLRRQGYYTVLQNNLVTGAATTTRVCGFEVVDTVREHERYIQALASSELIATAVFPSSFDTVADDLAEMVACRCRMGVDVPVAVILGGNYVGLKAYFDRALRERLEGACARYYSERVALITSKANRKVTYAASADADRYALEGDDKPVLPVDDAFPFGAGYRYPTFFDLQENAEIGMVEKIWSENLVHCSLGFMAAYEGIRTINEAVERDDIRTFAYYSWLEGRRALQAEYGLPIPGDAFVQGMFSKFASPYLTDTIARVVRQPMRKLGKNDRFMGPALLCMRHGIVPYFILRAAAYGFCFTDEHDEQSRQLAEIEARVGLEGTVEQVCGLNRADELENRAEQLLMDAVRSIRLPDRARFRPDAGDKRKNAA